jgi:hypothetical protein
MAPPICNSFTVRTDLLTVVKDLRKRNVPTFADGLYRCICDPTFMMHLRRDADFREIARYSRQPWPRHVHGGQPHDA